MYMPRTYLFWRWMVVRCVERCLRFVMSLNFLFEGQADRQTGKKVVELCDAAAALTACTWNSHALFLWLKRAGERERTREQDVAHVHYAVLIYLPVLSSALRECVYVQYLCIRIWVRLFSNIGLRPCLKPAVWVLFKLYSIQCSLLKWIANMYWNLVWRSIQNPQTQMSVVAIFFLFIWRQHSNFQQQQHITY